MDFEKKLFNESSYGEKIQNFNKFSGQFIRISS